MKIHYSKNEYSVWLNTVKNSVRKTSCQVATDISFQDGPSKRIVEYVLNSSIDFDGEIIAETLFTFLVVIDGLKELSLGLRMIFEDHLLKRSLTSANT